MMDLDMFIHGGKPLPPEVRAGAIRVRDALEKPGRVGNWGAVFVGV
ncbi:MAG: hypothetical protein WCP34_13790 [Pseudomonadota bacterium]